MMKRKRSVKIRSFLATLLLCFTQQLSSQSFDGGFNFYLPPVDTAASDFLPQFPRNPITSLDIVSIDGEGHFAVRGKPIRFFGTTFAADAAFPTKSKAWFVAGHLRKMGFNLVRFHHMDNPWSTQGIFEMGKDTRHLNSATLDRLENFIAELKKNGVYLDMNLHVSRTFNAQDGVPSYDSLPEFGKAVNFFDPQMLSLHKEYAKQLLTHLNPYTGVTLAHDPVLAMVEITNENSLYRFWRDGQLKTNANGGVLPYRHVRMLDSLWINYLASKYGTTDSLRKAWNAGVIDYTGSNQIRDGGFESPIAANWLLENDGSGTALISNDSSTVNKGKFSGRVVVQHVDGTDWHLQFKQTGLTLQRDSLYVISFAARSDSTRAITVSILKETSPWTWYGGTTAHLNPQWAKYSLSLKASETNLNNVRLSFTVGGQTGGYWFDEVSLTQSPVQGLRADESLELSSVERSDYKDCPSRTDQRVRDISSFYLKLESEYFSRMRSFLRDSLGVTIAIVGTNWNVGPADLAAQASGDYIDNHAYWDHPQFPTVAWSPTDWLINNTPMVSAADGGTIGGLMAGVPTNNKPYTISEYNHPYPNRFQTEGVLFISAYSSFHDVDGLMFFDYNPSSDDWETDKLISYFSISRNTAMMSLMPSCAFAYRNGYIAKAAQTLLLNYAPDDYLTLPKNDFAGWQGPSLVPPTLALTHAVRTSSFTALSPVDLSAFPAAPASPFVSDTKQITWNTDGILTINAPSFVGVSGILSLFSGWKIGPLTVLSKSDAETVTWISLTGDSLTQSPRSLLTVSARTQNTGMVWDGLRTFHNDWGQAPTSMEPASLTVQLLIQADSIHVYPLDTWGMMQQSIMTYFPVQPDLFSVNVDQTLLDYHTVWFGIQKYGAGVPLSVPASPANIPHSFGLEQNYPNPFNPSTRIRFSVSRKGRVVVTIHDVLGRAVSVLVDEYLEAGNYERSFSAGEHLASGVYYSTLTSGGRSVTRKMILLR